VLHAPRFVDLAPAEVYVTLLDDGTVLLFRAHDIASWPRTTRCESGGTICGVPSTRFRSWLDRRPTDLWSWDLTKLLGPATWTYFSHVVDAGGTRPRHKAKENLIVHHASGSGSSSPTSVEDLPG
jgi:hypothetical protein